MKVLVTGVTGLIGRALVPELRAAGHDVVGLARRPRPDVDLPVPVAFGDVTDPDLGSRLPPVDVVVHLAGLADAGASWQDPARYLAVNAGGTLNLLFFARKVGARFIFASSQRVYRPGRRLAETAPIEPRDPYGYSKWVGEVWCQMFARLFGVRTTVVRFFSVYGPGQTWSSGQSGVLTIFLERALRGEPLEVRAPSRRDFTFVADAAAGLRRVAEQAVAPGRVYNIATGRGTSLLAAARLIRRLTSSRSPVVARFTGPEESFVADIGRARRELGYEPRYTLKEGLCAYVAWLRARDPA